MSHPVSERYLRAVAMTWPFVARSAHAQGLTRLTRRSQGLPDAETGALLEDLTNWLQPRSRGLSLDALRAIGESAFFANGQDVISLGSRLVGTAKMQLCRAGGRVVVPSDARYSQRLEEVRWLTLLLPIDILIAALYAVEGNSDPPKDTLSLADPPLQRLLSDRPAAETHLHVGAAFSFGTLWTGIVGLLAADSALAAKLPRDSACPWGAPAPFATMLVAAAIGRVFLGAFLWSIEHKGDVGAFDKWLCGYLDGLSSRLESSHPRRVESLAHASLSTLVCGPDNGIDSCHLSMFFRKLCGPRAYPPRSLSKLAALDPLSSWLGACEDPWPEARFATRAIRYLVEHSDEAFAAVFWQYQRVRNMTFLFLVEQPGTAGLDWFQVHYGRLKPFRDPLRSLRFESALALESKGIRLGALEVRTSPSPSAASVILDAKSLERAAERWAVCHEETEVGLLFHFLKEREHGSGRLRRLHEDPRQLVHGCRYGAWAYRALREAMAIERAFRQQPELLRTIRGFDVASSELAVPTWATLPPLLRARRASEEAADVLRRRRARAAAEPCRITYHAGEDYVRLVEGIRRVHELIEYGVIRSGDRLGHATSLGEDVERWARGHARTMQPREDRLDDLLWELDRYGSGDFPGGARVAMIRDEVERHAKAIFSATVDLSELRDARRLRHDVDCLRWFGFPFVRPRARNTDAVLNHVCSYLTDFEQYRRGKELVSVEVTPAEMWMLGEAQRWLLTRVASMGVTVESNPSSNILIGDFPSMNEHPSQLLCPIGKQPSERGALLSINADDPVTFATCLSDEIAYVYGALLRMGVGSRDALEWIGARRDDGFGSRFTLPRLSGDALAHHKVE